jgi:hypothetical protein
MHYLVAPRLLARAELRRQAMKLQFWERGDAQAGDLECFSIEGQQLFAARVDDGYGLADGFYVVFCDLPNPEPDGTICVISMMRIDELFTNLTLAILRGRMIIAQERLGSMD